ncbi:hypothetical protein [Rickettsia rhipicephali]|nr:hypothetical protein [Rickettsia rhipicephali]
MNSDFKFKGSSTGDKLSAESDIISLYGQPQFSNGLAYAGRHCNDKIYGC